MATFRLYDCDIGITVNGTNYFFTHVNSVTYEDPEKTRLVRGANAGNKIGLTYKEGLKDPKTVTATIMGVEKAIYDVLAKAYDDGTRVDFNIVARSDGSSKIAKNAVICQRPRQNNLDDSAESLNMTIMLESFDVEEVHAS